MAATVAAVCLAIVVGWMAHCRGVAAWGPSGSVGFAPGWNGQARTPPMGWRSWNAYGADISQDIIQRNIDALTAKNWTVDGQLVSLLDVGYASVGIDEGWEGCGQGVNGTQHNADGTPVINTARFPDMKALVAYGHSRGVRMGWYLNGCACGEKRALNINYEGDIASLHSLAFDEAKFDGCGSQRNMTFYATLMRATGKNYSIENCHWGQCDDSDDSSCPSATWCPFNWYRVSGDINDSLYSWFKNLQATLAFQTATAPLSQPGCWAYPDMLEVGRVQGSVAWNRAHFGAWVITSSPLVLGLELTEASLTPIIDVITNPEALAINQKSQGAGRGGVVQAWYGHPGTLVANNASGNFSYAVGLPCESSDPNQVGWRYNPGTKAILHGDLCLDGANGETVVVAICQGTTSQQFTPGSNGEMLTANGQCLDVWDFAGPRVDIYQCNGGPNQLFHFTSEGQLVTAPTPAYPARCLSTSPLPPAGGATSPAFQVWAKPLSATDWALLVLNALPTTASNVTLDLHGLLGVQGPQHLRDVWQRRGMGTVEGTWTVTVPALDSLLVRLSSMSELDRGRSVRVKRLLDRVATIRKRRTSLMPISEEAAKPAAAGRATELNDVAKSASSLSEEEMVELLDALTVVVSEAPQTPFTRTTGQSLVEALGHVTTSSMALDHSTLTWEHPVHSILLLKKRGDANVTQWFGHVASYLVASHPDVGIFFPPKLFEEDLAALKASPDFARVFRKLRTWPLDRPFDDVAKEFQFDLCVCLGGDGTLLHLASMFQAEVPPVLCFGLGSLGFLTTFDISEYPETLESVLQGGLAITIRMRLRCTTVHANTGAQGPSAEDAMLQRFGFVDANPLHEYHVMNEVVVDRGPSPFLTKLDVYVDDELVTCVQGDGLIVATPTGSTAYSAAAGGSMVHPTVPCMLLTPICPHNVTSRPVLVPASAKIEIKVPEDSRNPAFAAFDGRNRQKLNKGDSVIISASPWPVPNIAKSRNEWFTSLSSCLGWNQRKRQGPEPSPHATVASNPNADGGALHLANGSELKARRGSGQHRSASLPFAAHDGHLVRAHEKGSSNSTILHTDV